MKFECYRHWSELPAGAGTLLDQACKKSLFLSGPWFETLCANAVREGQTLLLAAVVDDGSVLALLPLVENDKEHLQAFSHRYTALYSLLLAGSHEEGVHSCLAEGLALMPVRYLNLRPVADDDTSLSGLRRAMESRGFEWRRHFRFYNWVHRTRGQSFEQYMAGRPAQLRNTIARKSRKLEREHGCEMRMFRGDEVQRALGDYHRAYSASWKASEQYADLLDSVAINLSVPDWTRLAVLYAAGKPAAAQLWFVVHGVASIFRLAYDERWKRYSPGTLLTAYLMQHVIDIDRVVEIDFLTGNEAYKRDWMSERRERQDLVFYRRPAPGNQGESLVGKLKSWLTPQAKRS